MAQEIFSNFLQAATAGITGVNGLTTTSSRNVSLQNDVLWENSALVSLANILVESALVDSLDEAKLLVIPVFESRGLLPTTLSTESTSKNAYSMAR